MQCIFNHLMAIYQTTDKNVSVLAKCYAIYAERNSIVLLLWVNDNGISSF